MGVQICCVAAHVFRRCFHRAAGWRGLMPDWAVCTTDWTVAAGSAREVGESMCYVFGMALAGNAWRTGKGCFFFRARLCVGLVGVEGRGVDMRGKWRSN